MIAADLMTSDPASVRPDDTVREALTVMRDLDIRHVPVVNDEQEVVGMVSDRDLREVSVPGEGEEDEDILETPVSSVMWSDVLTVETEDDVTEVVDIMVEHKVGAVPVVEPVNRTLVGIVSYVDLLTAARDLL